MCTDEWMGIVNVKIIILLIQIPNKMKQSIVYGMDVEWTLQSRDMLFVWYLITATSKPCM